MAQFRLYLNPKKIGFNFSLLDTAEETVIPGVSVMTEGPAESHFVTVGEGDDAQQFQLMIDATTLEELVAASATYANGVKVKANHRSGIEDVIGRLTNFKMGVTAEGKKKATADFHLFKTSPLYAHMLNLVKTIPDAIGFSAFFDGPVERIGDLFFARCKELFSVDLVGEPSANPSGVFEIKVDSPQKDESAGTLPNMTPDEHKAALDAALKPIMDKLGMLETGYAKLAKHTKLDESKDPNANQQTLVPGVDQDAMYARFLEKAIADPKLKALVTAELQDTAKTLTALGLVPGTGPNSSVGDGRNPGQQKKIEDMEFLEIVELEFAKPENASKPDFQIIRDVAMAFPAKHRAAMEKKDASGRMTGLSRIPSRKVPYKAA